MSKQWDWVEYLRDCATDNPDDFPEKIMTPFGEFDCEIRKDVWGGPYIHVAVRFPPFVFPEIEKITFGTIHGIRIYPEQGHSDFIIPSKG